MSVYLLATLDTKGREAGYICDQLKSCNIEVTVVDTGCIGTPAFKADIAREQVFEAAGTTLAEMIDADDRGAAVTHAAKGVTEIVKQAYEDDELDGILGIGGSAGTTISTAAMRALPFGTPKVMVSTLASGHTRPFVGGKDIFMLNSVVDIAGINLISRTVLGQAAWAMAGLIKFDPRATAATTEFRPIVAASMFGVTTDCVLQAQKILEKAGFEVLVFHATGNGGEAMEGLIEDGMLAGVLDITTTELADELVGGILSAGPQRLTAAARNGIPQVISVGATDMVNFGPRDTVPERFADRTFYQHNDNVTLMRTTADECRQIGGEIGRKASEATGPAAILLPQHGVSAIDRDGQPFNDPEARTALFDAVTSNAGSVDVQAVDYHINDPEFAQLAANRLIKLIRP